MEETAHRVWRRNGFIGIFIAILAIFLFIPLLTKSFFAHLMLQICFTLLILSAIYTMSYERYVLWVGAAFIVPFIGLDAYSLFYNAPFYMVLGYGFYCAFAAFAIFILSKKVLSLRFIDTNLIFGVLTVYLLSGVLWAKLYFLVESIHTGSFHGIRTIDLLNENVIEAYETQFNLLYFSFTTIATLGVGDITPVHHLSKSLTVLEATIGQLFVAIVIGKVVNVWHARKVDTTSKTNKR